MRAEPAEPRRPRPALLARGALAGAGAVVTLVACGGPGGGQGQPSGTQPVPSVTAQAPAESPEPRVAGAGPTAAGTTGAGTTGAGTTGAGTTGAGTTGAGTTGARPTDVDTRFAQTMIAHHRLAEQLAGLAERRTGDAEVRYMARKIRARQAPEATTMLRWLNAWGEPVAVRGGPSPVAGMISGADLKELRKADRTRFDRQFCTMMIAHHGAAVALAEAEIAQGSRSEVKALAQEIITVHRTEIDLLNGLLTQL